ncbi:MAG: fibronectin type III domain-containing protein, partial [Gammaproteobacteria bacterium]|nr:fibronectin type III domain-containing protein [Gammaproteobacteria bacterium]
MTTTHNAPCHARPQRPGPGTPAGAGPARPPHGGRAWLWTGRPKPTAPPGILAGGRCPRRGAWRRLLLAALAVFGLVAGAAARANLSAEPNPSADGDYTVRWTAIAAATKYQLLEDDTLSYEGTSLSKGYTGKAAGSYEYTLTYCLYVPYPSPTTVCNVPSNYAAVTVTVSHGTVVPTAPTLTVPADDDDGAYEVSWSDPADAETFELEERVNNGAWASAYSGTATFKAFTSKGTGVYEYRVKACDDAGDCSGWSATGSVRVTRTSSTLTADPNPAPGGDYTVRWTASVLRSLYKLDESVNGAAATEVYSGTGLSKSFTDRDPGSYAYNLKVCFSLLGSTVCVPSGSVTVTVPEPEPSGSISASPSPCSIPAGQSRCTTTVTWSTENADGPCIFMEASQARFACGASGSKDAPWIGTAGATFLLKNRNAFTSDTLDEVTVRGELLPPSVPTLTVPADSFDGAYTVSWTRSTGATRYVLEESGSPGNAYDGTGTSTAISDKTDGTYRYRVRACIGTEPCSDWSPSAPVRVLLTPGVPGAITGPSTSTGNYTLRWTAATGTVSTYKLQEYDGTGAWPNPHEATTVQNTGALFKAFTNRADGTYRYRVQACNALSCGAFTAEKPVRVDGGTTPTGVPEAPAAPTVTPVDSMRLRVTWTAPADNGSAITDYDVEYQVHGESNWADHSFTGTGTSTTIGSLTPHTTYKVRVRARNGEGESGWSPPGTGTTDDVVPETPAAPTVEAEGRTRLEVMWSRPVSRGSAITDYDVEYQVDGEGESNWADHSFTGTGTTTTIGSLTPHTTYKVRVRARNGEGESGWSPPGTGSTPPNTEPDAVDDTATTAPGTAVTIDVLANDSDADGDPLSVDSVDDPANGAAAINGDGTLTYTPDAGFTGSDVFDYTVSDGEATDTATVTVLVSAVASELSAEPNPSATGNYTVRWTAPALGTSYRLEESADGGATWTPVYSGTALEHAVTGKADGTYHYRLSTCYIEPIHGGTICLLAGGPYPVDVETAPPGAPDAPGAPDVEADGSTGLDVTWVAPADNGSAITDYDVEYQVDGESNWTDHPFTGTGTSTTIGGLTPDTAYEVRVRAENGEGKGDWSSSGTATTGADTANTAPDAVDDTATTAPGTAVTIDVLANDSDADGDPLSVDSVDDPANGAAAINGDGTLTYTPDAGFTGSDVFDYTVSDGEATDTATVTVLVSAVASELSAEPNPSATGNYTVRWTAPALGTSYRLEESADGGATWTPVYSGTALEHAVTGKADGTYHYRLSACYTEPILGGTICVPAGGPYPVEVGIVPPPGVPGPIQGPGVSNGWHTLSWAAASGTPTRYELQEQRASEGWLTVVDDRVLRAELTERRAGVYVYRVRACKLDACSRFTASRIVRVNKALEARPNPSSDGNYELYWTPVPGSSRYQLLEDGAIVREGLRPSHRVTGKAPGTYDYTVDRCIAVNIPGLPADYCNLALYSTPLPVEVIAPPEGTISANPETCAIPAGQSRCTSTIDWFTRHATTACVFVSTSQARFACGLNGPKDAPWITRTGATFLLKAGNTFDSPTLDSVFVQANNPPTAVDDTADTTANTAVPVDVLANDSDADGDPLSIGS